MSTAAQMPKGTRVPVPSGGQDVGGVSRTTKLVPEASSRGEYYGNVPPPGKAQGSAGPKGNVLPPGPNPGIGGTSGNTPPPGPNPGIGGASGSRRP